ncbi:hypothetical protein K1719_006346 [Acacia pycnantha]|nr:hypothetical protein K1719_006346 [Acacia pycnantha]
MSCIKLPLNTCRANDSKYPDSLLYSTLRVKYIDDSYENLIKRPYSTSWIGKGVSECADMIVSKLRWKVSNGRDIPLNHPLWTTSYHQSISFNQIVGPLSFRVDSEVTVDLKNPKCPIEVKEPIFAFEYALQVLGSAKAVAWYSPHRQEFMTELRFFET